jgi:hypothetical protein
MLDEVNSSKAKVDEFKRSYENTLANVRKQYAGTGATESYIRALAAKKQEEQLPEYQNAIDNYNNSLSAYQAQVALIDKEFEMEYKDIAMEQQQFANQMQQAGFAFNMYQYANSTNKAMELEEAKYNFNNPDLNSSDPETARRALNMSLKGYYDDYGSIIQRPQAQALDDILNYAKDN